MSNPVTIDGVTYPSAASAARALGLSAYTVRYAARPDAERERSRADAQRVYIPSSHKERRVYRLTVDDVRSIRAEYAQRRARGETGRQIAAELAERFGVASTTINHVVLRLTWKDVD